MHGEEAIKMIRELKKSKWLPLYHEESIRKIVHEVTSLNTLLLRVMESDDLDAQDPEVAAGLYLHGYAIARNKRLALAYLMRRLRKIEVLCWDTGKFVSVESSISDEENSTHNVLSVHEKQYMAKYSELVMDYMGSVDMDLNLYRDPPKSLYVECRVIKDCGVIETETGTITLAKDTTHFIPRKDAELLIRQGFLRHTQS